VYWVRDALKFSFLAAHGSAPPIGIPYCHAKKPQESFAICAIFDQPTYCLLSRWHSEDTFLNLFIRPLEALFNFTPVGSCQ
jgi:hypothetical protein